MKEYSEPKSKDVACYTKKTGKRIKNNITYGFWTNNTNPLVPSETFTRLKVQISPKDGHYTLLKILKIPEGEALLSECCCHATMNRRLPNNYRTSLENGISEWISNFESNHINYFSLGSGNLLQDFYIIKAIVKTLRLDKKSLKRITLNLCDLNYEFSSILNLDKINKWRNFEAEICDFYKNSRNNRNVSSINQLLFLILIHYFGFTRYIEQIIFHDLIDSYLESNKSNVDVFIVCDVSNEGVDDIYDIPDTRKMPDRLSENGRLFFADKIAGYHVYDKDRLNRHVQDKISPN